MSDPYRLNDTPSVPRTDPPGEHSGGAHHGGVPDLTDPTTVTTSDTRRTALWVLLALSAGVNAATSAAGLPVAVSVSFGAVTLVCIGALARLHLRSKGRR